MAMLKDFLPAARDVEDAPLPDLASAILEVLKTAEMSLLNRHNFMSHVGQEYGSYRQSHDADVVQACGEAWSWLVSQGFIYDRSENWVALTRKAKAVPGREGFGQHSQHSQRWWRCPTNQTHNITSGSNGSGRQMISPGISGQGFVG